MSKIESLYRQTQIIKKLRGQNTTFDEIRYMLQNLSAIHGNNYDISLRSFQRDKQEIEKLFEIEIKYSRQYKHYYINSDQISSDKERLMETFELIHTLRSTEPISREIQFEKHHSPGTENLLGLLHAIRNRKIVRFIYTKYWDDKPTVRILKPLAMKEYRNRWYVVGIEDGQELIKCFGLDRLTDLEITKKSITGLIDFDINKHFAFSYGVIGPQADSQPEKIRLFFITHQGKYIKSLPLHPTQKILKDDQNGLLIELKIHVTEDFLMDILSHGSKVKVIKPQWLAEEIRGMHLDAANNSICNI